MERARVKSQLLRKLPLFYGLSPKRRRVFIFRSARAGRKLLASARTRADGEDDRDLAARRDHHPARARRFLTLTDDSSAITAAGDSLEAAFSVRGRAAERLTYIGGQQLDRRVPDLTISRAQPDKAAGLCRR